MYIFDMVPSLDSKIKLSKNKIFTKNQANTCIFEKSVVPLQHDFDYEEYLSLHHIGGAVFYHTENQRVRRFFNKNTT